MGSFEFRPSPTVTATGVRDLLASLAGANRLSADSVKEGTALLLIAAERTNLGKFADIIGAGGSDNLVTTGYLQSPSHRVVSATGGGLVRLIAEATATMSGASTDIDVDVPANCRILGVQLRVDTLIASGDGAASWAAAYKTGATQAIATGQAFAKNTKVNKNFDTNADTDITTDVTKITITPNAGTFSAGVVRAIVYYEAFIALPDAA